MVNRNDLVLVMVCWDAADGVTVETAPIIGWAGDDLDNPILLYYGKPRTHLDMGGEEFAKMYDRQNVLSYDVVAVASEVQSEIERVSNLVLEAAAAKRRAA